MHIPVLLEEVLKGLSPIEGRVFIDATFGEGGYTRGLLEGGARRVIAIDRDPDVEEKAKLVKDQYGDRFSFYLGCFDEISHIARVLKAETVHGIVLDVGVSSHQLDQAHRGFSFMQEGPLDMRMSQKGMCAKDVVNQYSQEALADILYLYGEERCSRKIAKAIIKARPLFSTSDLVKCVQKVLFPYREKKHPATRTFQALRIYVNDELKQLEGVLQQAENILCPLGCLAVVSFHSLEDRIVKNFFKTRVVKKKFNKYLYHSCQKEEDSEVQGTFQMRLSNPTVPSLREKTINKRSCSAKLRVGEKLS